MIKKLIRGVVQATIIILIMLLIAFVTKFIGAGGRELVIPRVIIITMICLTMNMIVGKRA